MTNLDAMCQQTFDRHQRLIAGAARRRLLSSGLHGPDNPATARHWRVRVASLLRRVADRLEPVADRPQALRLLDGNGHRSAIV